jgi:hypothetical protein
MLGTTAKTISSKGSLATSPDDSIMVKPRGSDIFTNKVIEKAINAKRGSDMFTNAEVAEAMELHSRGSDGQASTEILPIPPPPLEVNECGYAMRPKTTPKSN